MQPQHQGARPCHRMRDRYAFRPGCGQQRGMKVDIPPTVRLDTTVQIAARLFDVAARFYRSPKVELPGYVILSIGLTDVFGFSMVSRPSDCNFTAGQPFLDDEFGADAKVPLDQLLESPTNAVAPLLRPIEVRLRSIAAPDRNASRTPQARHVPRHRLDRDFHLAAPCSRISARARPPRPCPGQNPGVAVIHRGYPGSDGPRIAATRRRLISSRYFGSRPGERIGRILPARVAAIRRLPRRVPDVPTGP